MEFYLTAPNGTRLQFPMEPEAVVTEREGRVQTYDTLGLGQVAQLRGRGLQRVQWDGLFPGAPRVPLGITRAWRPPTDLVAQLKAWQEQSTRLWLLVTETSLNVQVYVSRFQEEWGGGHGDCRYRLELVEARSVTVAPLPNVPAPAPPPPPTRPVPPLPRTYTVVPGDTLWGIAQRFTGNGFRWTELWNLNAPMSSGNPDRIFPGEVLRLPDGW